MKRKRITPLQRARQSASRVNALQAVASYGRKIGAKRAASVKAALNELRRRGVDWIGLVGAPVFAIAIGMALTMIFPALATSPTSSHGRFSRGRKTT